LKFNDDFRALQLLMQPDILALQFAIFLLQRFRAGTFGAPRFVRQAGSDARAALLPPLAEL